MQVQQVSEPEAKSGHHYSLGGRGYSLAKFFPASE